MSKPHAFNGQNDSSGETKGPISTNGKQSSREPEEDPHKARCTSRLPKRYLLLVLTFFGLFQMYAVRTCLSVAIVAMASNRTVTIRGKTVEKEAEFKWNSQMQGFILGSFYYGYTILQIPAGWLALHFGGKILFGWSIMLASFFTILTPPVVRYSTNLYIALRIAEGLVLGVVAAAHHALWSKWSPVFERSIILSLSFTGAIIGTVVTMPVTGLLADSEGDWPSVFYFFGGLGILWFIAWQLLAYDSPRLHPTISQKEVDHIGETWDGTKEINTHIPWKSIATSWPVWAINVGFITSDWCFYSLLICIPLYMKQVLHFDVAQAGILSSVPYMVMFTVSPVSGLIADRLREKQILSTTAVRKIFFAAGLLISSAFLVGVGYVTTPVSAVILISLGIGLFGLQAPSTSPNLIDVAPKYAGLLMGIANCGGSFTGFIAPAVVGAITVNGALEEWRLVFYITALVSVLGVTFYTIFGSGKTQDWAND